MHILVVNINNLQMTKDLLGDIYAQTHPYCLRIVDNGSQEEGTRDYFESLNADVIYNDTNVDLCRLWNKFFSETTDQYLCFLNNDVRIPPNFVSDTVAVFEMESEVGCVVHIAGQPENYSNQLEYKIAKRKFCQGWDLTVRREAYTIIPDDIKVYGGDDYIFSNLYLKGWKVAVALSSPIIHYNAQSMKWYTGNRKESTKAYLRYGYKQLQYGARLDRLV